MYNIGDKVKLTVATIQDDKEVDNYECAAFVVGNQPDGRVRIKILARERGEIKPVEVVVNQENLTPYYAV